MMGGMDPMMMGGMDPYDDGHGHGPYDDGVWTL